MPTRTRALAAQVSVSTAVSRNAKEAECLAAKSEKEKLKCPLNMRSKPRGHTDKNDSNIAIRSERSASPEPRGIALSKMSDSTPATHNALEADYQQDNAVDPGHELNLPVESARQTPEAQDNFLRDGPHPLSLLSDVGAGLRKMAEDDSFQSGDNMQTSRSVASGSSVPNDVILYPGWTKSQLDFAARQKRVYYQYGLSAIKRDVAPSLDPISRGLVDEEDAEILVRR
jgi:hypothetical protein